MEEPHPKRIKGLPYLRMFLVPHGLKIDATVNKDARYIYPSRPAVLDKVVSISTNVERVLDAQLNELHLLPYIEFYTLAEKIRVRWFFSPFDFDSNEKAVAVRDYIYGTLLSNSYDYKTALENAVKLFESRNKSQE